MDQIAMQNSQFKDKRYYSLSEYYNKTFGGKVYKLALDGGMTCPNRDGKIGTGGCIFCSAGGSGDFAQKQCESVSRQIDLAKLRLSKKHTEDKYIAYFQSYTNTYADIDYLKQLFYSAIEQPEIVGLSIATRPDCLPQETLSLLNNLNKIKPVFIELGLQTIHEETAKFIRRGYDLSVFDTAVKNLKKIGVNVVVHVIFGLPHESHKMMIDTVKYLAQSGVQGIKIQLLHVLKGTDLQKMYEDGEFKTLTLDEYVDLVCESIELLPKTMVVHRITGDAPKNILVAPSWSADKKRVLQTIWTAMDKRGIRQGKISCLL